MPAIPRTTIPAAPPPTEIGPFAVGNNTKCVVNIDPTVNGGLNSLPTSASCIIELDSTIDGVTWALETSYPVPCGPVVDFHTGAVRTNWQMVIQGFTTEATALRLMISPSQQVVLGGGNSNYAVS